MKRTIQLCLTVGALALLPGCARLSYTETRTDGTVTSFKSTSFFANKQLSKLMVAKKTEKTSQGLGLGSSSDEVATDAIVATGNIIAAMTEAAVKGAVKGAKP